MQHTFEVIFHPYLQEESQTPDRYLVAAVCQRLPPHPVAWIQSISWKHHKITKGTSRDDMRRKEVDGKIKAESKGEGEREINKGGRKWLKLRRWHTCRTAQTESWIVLEYYSSVPPSSSTLNPSISFPLRHYILFSFRPLVSVPLESGLWRGLELGFISYPISAVYLQPAWLWIFIWGQ